MRTIPEAPDSVSDRRVPMTYGPDAGSGASEGLELQLVSRKDSGSHAPLSTRVANVPCSISSIEDRGARPYVAGLEVARPNEAAYSVRAPRNNPWLTPTLTADEIADTEDDRWLSGLQSVAIIYVFLFVLGWIGWNAHTISAWLYTHAQGIVGALLGGGK